MSELKDIANAIVEALGSSAITDNHQGTLGIGTFLWHARHNADKVRTAVETVSYAVRSLAGKGTGESSIPLGEAIVRAGNSINEGLMAVAEEVKNLRLK
jgi:hypothetical protein